VPVGRYATQGTATHWRRCPLPAASDDAEQQAAQGEVVSGLVAFGDLIAASAASEYPGGGQREELIAACFLSP
jgi:hypothetical protein